MKFDKTTLVLLIAAVTSCGPKVPPVDWAAIEDHEITIFDVTSTAPCVPAGRKIDYQAHHMIDRNLFQAWQVDMSAASTYDAVFTLSENLVSSILIWNGNVRHQTIFPEYGRASKVTVKNEATGEILGIFNLANELDVTCCMLNKEVEAGADGSIKVRLDFSDGVIPGTKFNKFCISQVQFWAGPDPRPLAPIADRAEELIHGPVKNFTTSNGSVTFNKDGFKVRRSVFRFANNQETYTIFCHAYFVGSDGYLSQVTDDFGRTVSYVNHPDPSISAETTSIAYDQNSNVTRYHEEGTPYCDGEGHDIRNYTYDGNGNVLTELVDIHWWMSENRRYYQHSYTVTETDRYGNWTLRTNETGATEYRTIEYYTPYFSQNTYIVPQK